jgi:hypothetical protein
VAQDDAPQMLRVRVEADRSAIFIKASMALGRGSAPITCDREHHRWDLHEPTLGAMLALAGQRRGNAVSYRLYLLGRH